MVALIWPSSLLLQLKDDALALVANAVRAVDALANEPPANPAILYMYIYVVAAVVQETRC